MAVRLVQYFRRVLLGPKLVEAMERNIAASKRLDSTIRKLLEDTPS